MAADLGGRMAVTTASPDTGAQPIQDPVTFDEAALLFLETEQPEFQGVRLSSLVSRLQRWAKEDGLRTERRGRAHCASFSDLLEAHARRYPAPGGRP